jgi:hypothetical protein
MIVQVWICGEGWKNSHFSDHLNKKANKSHKRTAYSTLFLCFAIAHFCTKIRLSKLPFCEALKGRSAIAERPFNARVVREPDEPTC